MFNFIEMNFLTDGEIDLLLVDKLPADDEKGHVPCYEYGILVHNQMSEIGRVCLRIGDNENIFYGGHVGYYIVEGQRGHHFAAKACQLIKEVALAHEMDTLIITCNPDNIPSRKTCEYLGATLIEIVDLPPYNEEYLEGDRQKCRYEWCIKG